MLTVMWNPHGFDLINVRPRGRSGRVNITFIAFGRTPTAIPFGAVRNAVIAICLARIAHRVIGTASAGDRVNILEHG
jgi:hypothetical protein